MKKIRVVLADDHQMVRKGFRALLEKEADIQVMGEAEDGREAMRLVEQMRPDVLVMDLEMPGMSGLEAVRQLKKRSIAVRTLILTMHRQTNTILQALWNGAAGYALKDAAVPDLIEGIRTVYHGEVFLSPTIATQVVTRLMEGLREEEIASPLDLLTDREREVLLLIAEGYARQEIAEKLSISPKTVDTHRANLMRKLDLNNDAALVRLAVRYGLVPLDK